VALREVGISPILHGLGNWPKKGSLSELAIEVSTVEHGRKNRQDVKPLPPASGAFEKHTERESKRTRMKERERSKRRR